jgi:hypothetical protein
MLLLYSYPHKLLEAIYSFTDYPSPTRIDEYESLITSIIKSLEFGGDPNIRECVADTVSSILNISQRKHRVNSTITVLNIEIIFRILKNQVIKSSARDVRVGILHCYVFFLKVL